MSLLDIPSTTQDDPTGRGSVRVEIRVPLLIDGCSLSTTPSTSDRTLTIVARECGDDWTADPWTLVSRPATRSPAGALLRLGWL